MTVLTLTNGMVYTGKVLAFMPVEGWMSISDESAPEKIYFTDIYSGLSFKETDRGIQLSVDVKELARDMGWKGPWQ
jgi:hypothetical protein